ncbi:MAG: hypothetical protein LBI89_02890, partial [Prevotellaceae bacterium]|nr:hypothetical protein [Prevotellaceae bacterium]
MAKKKHAGRKKYVNIAEQQRQQEAQYKKLFFEKLRTLCEQIGDVSLFHQISPVERMLIYKFRGAPLKVVAAPGAKIQKRLLDALVKTIKSQQLLMKLEVIKDIGQMMTFADYSLVGMSFEYNLCESDSEYPNKELFAKYAELRDERERAYEKGILDICKIACWVFDDLGRKYLHTYTFDIDLPVVTSSIHAPKEGTSPRNREWRAYMEQDFRTHQKVTIGTYPLEVRKVNIDGEIHSAIQTGGLYYVDNKPQFIPFTISLEDLHVNTPFSKLGLPVYIQQHALDRMRERIGGLVPPAFYKSILVEALLRKNLIPTTKKRLLIACFTNELKIGYFVAELVDGIILIRTFLLLTNGGTPEG